MEGLSSALVSTEFVILFAPCASKMSPTLASGFTHMGMKTSKTSAMSKGVTDSNQGRCNREHGEALSGRFMFKVKHLNSSWPGHASLLSRGSNLAHNLSSMAASHSPSSDTLTCSI
eukprot:3689387-Amphidinium_carterae.1